MLHDIAYIDAGSGSYLLAAIASGTAGAWFFVRSKFAALRGRKLEDAPVVETEATDA